MSSKTRHLALVRPEADGQATRPLGVKRDMLRILSQYNTAPDGSPESASVLYGPGYHIELPYVGDDDEVTQALLTVVEEEIAWPVLARLCKATGWRLLDTETGRTFGG